MISFEITDATTNDQLQIYLDNDGLGDLITQLKLLSGGKTDHVHLMAESWGGTHLREEPINSEAVAMKHVKVTLL